LKINISVPEEMQIVAAIQERIRKLKSMKGDHSSEINHCEEVLEKVNQANYEQAQEIMRNEG
jgi:hypothetical protein